MGFFYCFPCFGFDVVSLQGEDGSGCVFGDSGAFLELSPGFVGFFELLDDVLGLVGGDLVGVGCGGVEDGAFLVGVPVVVAEV